MYTYIYIYIHTFMNPCDLHYIYSPRIATHVFTFSNKFQDYTISEVSWHGYPGLFWYGYIGLFKYVYISCDNKFVQSHIYQKSPKYPRQMRLCGVQFKYVYVSCDNKFV